MTEGTLTQITPPGNSDSDEENFDIGRAVMVKWTKDEIGVSGWKMGWYKAVVQSSSITVSGNPANKLRSNIKLPVVEILTNKLSS